LSVAITLNDRFRASISPSGVQSLYIGSSETTDASRDNRGLPGKTARIDNCITVDFPGRVRHGMGR
jgi:hypothetical protein